MLFTGFFYFEKSSFLSAFSISHDSYDVSEFEIIDTRFFSKLTNSSFLEGFSDSASSFGEHYCSFFMTDTEGLSRCSSFTRTDASRTRLEPKK